MFNLTPRWVKNSQTGEHVAPNTYEFCTSRKKGNYAPFLSTEPRNPSFIKKVNTHSLYDVSGARKRVKGGSTIGNKATRFVYPSNGTPGPMSYKPKTQIPCKAPRPILGQGKLYFCRVPYDSSVSAPSIPTKIDQNEYDLDNNGRLIKIPLDKTEDLAHKTYNQVSSSLNTRHGCKWSGRTAKRFTVNSDESPGPQSYNVQICRCSCKEADKRYREMARLFTFIPRYIEAQELKAKNNGMPGPGYYDINLNRTLSSLMRGRSINPRPFINQSKRFETKCSDTPAPGHYEVLDINCLKRKSVSKRNCPFGFEASRFSRREAEESPGPTTYNIKSPMQEKLQNSLKSNINPPFNQLAERDMIFVSRDMFLTPAATDYPLESDDEDDDTIERRRILHYSHVFSSCVQRFPKICSKDKVSPARYSISDAFNKNRNRKTYNTGKVPFNCSGPGRSSIFKQSSDNPGPADYEKKRELGSLGYYFRVSPRFVGNNDGKPAPGTYNIHPDMDTSISRAFQTHNIRLKQNAFKEVLKTCKGSYKKTSRRLKFLLAVQANNQSINKLKSDEAGE